MPVFWFTSARLGGWGLTPLEISVFLGFGGLAQALWILIAFPPLQIRFGTKRMLIWTAFGWPIVCTFYPGLSLALKAGWKTFFWATSFPGMFLLSGISMSFST